jgi:hypothetical protein
MICAKCTIARFRVLERRPGVIQVLAPPFHEDGDMVDIFLDEARNGTSKLRVSDHGMALMRLTYSYDLDTENKQRIFSRILSEYNPRPRALPIPEHDEHEVDYQFDAGPRPLYLFGVKDNDKARLATISCLEFLRHRLPFKSVMVHQDFESGISRKDRTRITNAADKQFTSLDDFRETGPQFFERERAA